MSPGYLLRRLASVVLVIAIVSFAVFVITLILPGNAAVMILGEYATDEQIRAMEETLGLNRPWYVQYLHWAGGLVQGDWGMSLRLALPVTEVVGQAFRNSALLAVTALVAVTVIAVPIGILAALRRGTVADLGIGLIAYVGIAMPEFVTATLLLVFLAGPAVALFPAGGFIAPARILAVSCLMWSCLRVRSP